MTSKRTIFSIAVAAMLVTPLFGVAQDLHPSRRPSPLGLSRITVGDAYISVHDSTQPFTTPAHNWAPNRSQTVF